MRHLSASILDSYPKLSVDPDPILKELIAKDDHVFVVLDDDPTGVQCVHDINVYTDWSYETMKKAFACEKLFFILTNSRAMTPAESKRCHEQIIEAVDKAAKETNKKYLYISRGDSTLRGHYPLETDILSQGLEKRYGKVDGEILMPFFKEGNRFTIDDVHYVKYGNELVPCGETEFAKDKSFGYKSSDLKAYICEKTNGQIKEDEVLSISLDDLRAFDIDKILDVLRSAQDKRRIIVNAIDHTDVKVFCIALYKAMEEGKIFVFRSAAALVKAIGGVSDIPLLCRSQMIKEEAGSGGIILVGSHTAKTTAQLNKLLELEEVEGREFKCSKILESKQAFDAEIEEMLKWEEENISQGKTIVVYTERTLLSLPGDNEETALKRSVAISDGVCQLVKNLKVEPAFVVAKGGITSADVGTKGLGIRKARVLGQIQPGIPVWQADDTSKFPRIPYIIFPGNVGDEDTLKKAVEVLLTR